VEIPLAIEDTVFEFVETVLDSDLIDEAFVDKAVLLLVSFIVIEEIMYNVLVTVGNTDFNEDVDELFEAFVFVVWPTVVDLVICPESEVLILDIDLNVVVGVGVVVLIVCFVDVGVLVLMVCFVDVLFLEIKDKIVEIGLTVSI
jgi:hypothetical protein